MTDTGLDLEAVAAAVAAQGAQVAGIRQSWDHIPDRVPQVPALLVGFAEPVTYHTRFSSMAVTAEIQVIIVCGRALEAHSQRLIRRFQSHIPADDDEQLYPSLVAALDADPTLGGACKTSTMSTSSQVLPIQIGGDDHLAVEFRLTVHA